MKTLQTIWWVIRLQFQSSRMALIWVILYNSYEGVATILNAFLIAQLITSVTEAALSKANIGQVYFWLISIFIIGVIRVVFRGLNVTISHRLDQNLEIATSEIYFKLIYQLSQQQFEDEVFNTKLARAREALSEFTFATQRLAWGLSSLISFMGAITAIIIVAPFIGVLITIITIPIVLINVRQNKLNEKVNKDVEPIDRVAFRSRWLLIDPNYMPEVRLINGFHSLFQSWKLNMKKSQDINYSNHKSMLKWEIIGNVLQPAVGLCANIYFLGKLFAGALGLDKFIFLRGLVEQAGNSAITLAMTVQTLHKQTINIANFREIQDAKPAVPNGTVKVTAPLTIEFKDVGFSYPDTQEKVLDAVSFQIVPGSRLAVVGENGAGKSTLVKLLLRQYLPTRGTITVNGHDIADIDQASYYQALSILSQDFLIVDHLSIYDNLTIGLNRTVDTESVYEALALTGADDFVRKLPHKLQQRLDPSFDDGGNLSGGQLQRLGVARALLRAGDLMILDEPTSAIDAKAEYSIFNNIYKAHGDKSTLIISHRFSTVRKADRIMVMEQGKVIEYGSHEELIAYGGIYKEMFDIQAEGYR